MTEAIYLEVTEKAETARKAKRRVSVSGMLKILGVSRSGYNAWLKHVPSNAEKRRETVKPKSRIFTMNLSRIMGAPKITQVLRKSGEIISERTGWSIYETNGHQSSMGKTMDDHHKRSDFSSELQISLMNSLIRNDQMPFGVLTSHISGTIDGFVYLTSIMDLYSRKIHCLDTFKHTGGILRD